MATTRESIHDAFAWIRGLLLVWLRWGVVLGVAFGLFGVAVWLTSGEDYGNCGDVSDEQRAALEAFALPTEPAACTRGVYSARILGLDGRVDRAVDSLAAFGWTQADRFLPLFYDLDVRCLRSDRPGSSDIELNLAATRGGSMLRAEARATGSAQPCARMTCSSLSTGCSRSDVVA